MRVRADVAQSQWPWIGDQLAEYPSTAGHRVDLPLRRLIQARGDESLKLAAGAVEDPQRRISGPGQLARRLEDALEHQVNVHQRRPAP